MRVDSLLLAIAKRLGVEIIAPLAGGEFGAVLVLDTQGRKLILKALPSIEFAPRFALGAELAGRRAGALGGTSAIDTARRNATL